MKISIYNHCGINTNREYLEVQTIQTLDELGHYLTVENERLDILLNAKETECLKDMQLELLTVKITVESDSLCIIDSLTFKECQVTFVGNVLVQNTAFIDCKLSHQKFEKHVPSYKNCLIQESRFCDEFEIDSTNILIRSTVETVDDATFRMILETRMEDCYYPDEIPCSVLPEYAIYNSYIYHFPTYNKIITSNWNGTFEEFKERFEKENTLENRFESKRSGSYYLEILEEIIEIFSAYAKLKH